ncbi:MAG: hypothetical protein OWR62_09190, partial [Sulfobacillus thermotolerans]|nr:hypothetical protein [Sulfobacillus thermotolerans]
KSYGPMAAFICRTNEPNCVSVEKLNYAAVSYNIALFINRQAFIEWSGLICGKEKNAISKRNCA